MTIILLNRFLIPQVKEDKMQNEFVIKAKRLLKKATAISTSAVMMGATMFGAAAAADLKDYPAPFIKDGKWVGLIVVGNDAAPADIIGATDIAVALAQSATTAATGTGTTTVTGGVTKDIVLGNYLGNVTPGGFDYELEDDDVKGLKDSSLTFASKSYDFHDAIVFQNGSTADRGPRIVTSLVSNEDDYKSGIYMEVGKETLGYYFLFDTTINISTASSTDTLPLSFMGKKVKITSVTDRDTFTARVGEEVFMNVGDTATVGGKKITLKNVGSATTNTPVIVDVDGVTETVTGTETVNGIEINVAESFYAENTAERAATLVIGTEAVETYDDGEEFVAPCAVAWKTSNCKKEDPDWVWDVDELAMSATGDIFDVNGANGGPTFGVVNDYIINDDSDKPITVGGKYDFPAGGYEVRFDGLTVADTDYMELTITYDGTTDLSDAGGEFATLTAEPVFLIESSESEGLYVVSGGANKRTNRIYLTVSDNRPTLNNTLNVLYRDPSTGRVTFAGNASQDGTNAKIGEISYSETKSTNIEIEVRNSTAPMAADTLNLTLDIIDDNNYLMESGDDIYIQLGHPAMGDFDGLGATGTTEETQELIWARETPDNKTIGTKDEDHRTKYGIVIKDPKGNSASDRVKLLIPKDSVRAKVTVAGPETTTTTVGGAVQIQSVAGVPVAKLDTEVTDKTAYDLILVGDAAVNKLAAEVAGITYPTYGEGLTTAFGYSAGEATLKLYENAFGGTKTALLVAGWDAADTRNAAAVLKDYTTYKANLAGKQVIVKSVGGVISVSEPTVTTTTTTETTTTTTT